MEHRTYLCNYCKKEYIPKRRQVQKFCSASCRVGSHQQQSKKQQLPIKKDNREDSTHNSKVTEMSLAGIGNSAIGVASIELVKILFTPEQNKPATKADIEKITARLERFQEVGNLPSNILGQKPYFDNLQGIIIYKKSLF